jgi:CubicO group peptidase (beta-lactamase class C family)
MLRILPFTELAVIVLMLAPAASGQSNQRAQLEATIESLMAEAEVTGLGLALVEGGEVSYEAGFGVRSAATRPPLDTLTVFEAASLTKPVVAFAVMQLVDEGLLDLDRPLVEYAEYADLAHTSRAALVTARMVLSHTSGLPNWRPQGGQLNFSNAPGQGFVYSGEGMLFLQRTVEAILGAPLHAVVRDRVLVPLGMRSSSLIWRDAFDSHISVGHSDDGTPLNKFRPTEANAAYSLHTTAGDYGRFLAAVLAGRGLSVEAAAEMRSVQSDAGDGISWGLGWGLEETSRGKAIWHWGDNRGFKSFVAGYPGQGRGFVFFTNSDNGMLILKALTEILDKATHPAVAWLNYEEYDNPSFRLGRELSRRLDDSTGTSLRKHFADLKREFDADAFSEDTLNDLGYRLLRTGRTEQAISVFELNVSEYPQASNPYDSLGEAYLVAGMLERALLNYRVAVDLDPENDSAKAMIARLESELRARN